MRLYLETPLRWTYRVRSVTSSVFESSMCPFARSPFVSEATKLHNKEETVKYLLLQPPEAATTVRVQDGRTLTTDGPFVAIKEALGGYLVLEADDFDAAIELASRIPAARMGGAVEVRPVMED
jgi:hypothetical protein